MSRWSRAWRRVLAARLFVVAHVHQDATMLGLGGVVGLGTGLLAALLIAAVDLVESVAWTDDVGSLELLVVPTVGGLVVGLLVTYVVEESRAPVVQVMRTIAIRSSRFRAGVPLTALGASGIALGTGASGGREGPIVLIGGAVGSLFGRLFAVGEDRLRALVAAGAAAGIGASFNAPIGGMLFALELILGAFRGRSLQVVVVASVVGSVTARELIGPDIIYAPETLYGLNDPRELLLYGLLGLLAVGVAQALMFGEMTVSRALSRVRVWPPLKVAAGGLGVGLVALVTPEVLGTGEDLPAIDGVREPIQHMIDGLFGDGWSAVGALALLAVAKIVATSFAIGSGSAVGTFAPLLFAGAAAGGALGHLAQIVLDTEVIEPGALALVGMAATFGSAARAPLTAIVIVFELTGDYQLVLPLMLATGIALFVGDRIQAESIYTRPLREQGIVYAEPEDVDIMQTVQVGEVMTSDPDTVRPTMPLEELRVAFRRSGHHGFPVVEGEDRLVGIVTVEDLERVDSGATGHSRMGAEDLRVRDICTRQVTTVVPGDPVFRALRRMASLDVGRVPVVDPMDHGRLVGLVRRQDLVKAYQRAVVRSLGAQQRQESSRLRDLAGVHFVELLVQEGAAAAGRAVQDIRWPRRTVLTSVRRGGEVITPHGDTVLNPGDEVIVLTGREEADEVRALLHDPAEPPYEHAPRADDAPPSP